MPSAITSGLSTVKSSLVIKHQPCLGGTGLAALRVNMWMEAGLLRR